MLTSEAELAADTKIDKDGRGVRSKQQKHPRKEHKKGIWSVCRPQTLPE